MFELKIEKDMYPFIKAHLEKNEGCTNVKIDTVKFYDVKEWRIDVIGLLKSRTLAVEAKLSISVDSILSSIKQAQFYKNACTDVYLCFPKGRYESLKPDIRQFTETNCDQEGLGIYLLNEEGVIERLIPAKISTVNFELYHDVLLQLTQPYTPNPSEIQGARVYIIKHICHLINNNMTAVEELKNLIFTETGVSSSENGTPSYWRKNYINPRTTPEKTFKSTITAMIELGLMEEINQSVKLTFQGRILKGILQEDDYKKNGEFDFEIRKELKVFFLQIALQYTDVKLFINKLKKEGRILSINQTICPSCGKSFWDCEVFETFIKCPYCTIEIDINDEKVALNHKLRSDLGFNPYKGFVFWINSEVLPVKTSGRNEYIEYEESSFFE